MNDLHNAGKEFSIIQCKFDLQLQEALLSDTHSFVLLIEAHCASDKEDDQMTHYNESK